MKDQSFIFQSIPTWLGMLFLCWGCANDVQEVRKVTENKRIPLEVQENLEVRYTDSTELRMEMEAPLAESYPHLKEPQREFPRGLKVRFFNKNGELSSRLRADYALQLLEEGRWEARGNVVVINREGEKLQTEKLFWDSRRERIYTEAFVRMTTEDEVILGHGFEADQNFEQYEVKAVTGTLMIEEDV
jgi:LPS export ABC transporter protein LptC